MIETKHTVITEQLKQRIIAGSYDKKLPPLRSLMQEFNVSMQTINKAIKPLSAGGLISSGPRGSVINYTAGKRPKHYALGVLCPSMASTGEAQVALRRISEYMQFLNYNTMLIDQQNERVKRDPDFWQNCPVDILIFGFRTLTLERALAVQRSGIISLVQHYAGDLPVHVVEYDSLNTIDSAVGQLREKGYRRIALQFNGPLIKYHEFAIDKWTRTREKYGIECPGYEKPVYYSEEGFDLSKPLPEVIVCWHTSYGEMLEKVKAAGLSDRIKIVSYSHNSYGYENYIPMNPPPEKEFWGKIRECLTKVIAGVPGYLHYSVPFDAVFPAGIPDKK